jgi:hypothetical protein
MMRFGHIPPERESLERLLKNPRQFHVGISIAKIETMGISARAA